VGRTKKIIYSGEKVMYESSVTKRYRKKQFIKHFLDKSNQRSQKKRKKICPLYGKKNGLNICAP
jgi:hypothetical protein